MSVERYEIQKGLLGALVEWTEDRRPMPEDEIAKIYPEAVSDMSLVTKEQGRVEAIDRTLFGEWRILVNHNGAMIEKKVSDLRILSPNTKICHDRQIK